MSANVLWTAPLSLSISLVIRTLIPESTEEFRGGIGLRTTTSRIKSRQLAGETAPASRFGR